MSNKTSDKNVANIEKYIKNIKQYINLVLDKGYCDCNELNVISTGKYCDGSKNVAYSMQNILLEREQDKARIKELESKLEEANKQLDLDYVDENYIPKQKAKEMQAKIKELEAKLEFLKKQIDI